MSKYHQEIITVRVRKENTGLKDRLYEAYIDDPCECKSLNQWLELKLGVLSEGNSSPESTSD